MEFYFILSVGTLLVARDYVGLCLLESVRKRAYVTSGEHFYTKKSLW